MATWVIPRIAFIGVRIVTDVGEKLVLGAVGQLGGLSGAKQIGLDLLKAGDVDVASDEANDLPSFVANRHAASKSPLNEPSLCLT